MESLKCKALTTPSALLSALMRGGSKERQSADVTRTCCSDLENNIVQTEGELQRHRRVAIEREIYTVFAAAISLDADLLVCQPRTWRCCSQVRSCRTFSSAASETLERNITTTTALGAWTRRRRPLQVCQGRGDKVLQKRQRRHVGGGLTVSGDHVPTCE